MYAFCWIDSHTWVIYRFGTFAWVRGFAKCYSSFEIISTLGSLFFKNNFVCFLERQYNDMVEIQRVQKSMQWKASLPPLFPSTQLFFLEATNAMISNVSFQKHFIHLQIITYIYFLFFFNVMIGYYIHDSVVCFFYLMYLGECSIFTSYIVSSFSFMPMW